MRTYQPKHKDIKRDWHLIDASGKVLGRIATESAVYLMGKHKPTYATHMDMGDYVVVINAKELVVTGRKENQKMYYRHSGYPGGLKEIKYKQMKKTHPERILELAVFGMLPKNRLRDKRMTRLRIFAGEDTKYTSKFTNAKN